MIRRASDEYGDGRAEIVFVSHLIAICFTLSIEIRILVMREA